MPPYTVLSTFTIPNPRKDINPSARLIVVAYRTPWRPLRRDVFGENENWPALLAQFVEEDQRLFSQIPHRLTLP